MYYLLARIFRPEPQIMGTIKTWTKSALCALYKYSGVMRVQETLARWRGRSFAAVLLFHRVTDAIPEDGLTVGTAHFRRICRMLRRSFHVVPLVDIVRLVRSGGVVPARTVAITFDDCYRDNLDAARTLAAHGLPATFFVPTAFVSTDHVFPWDHDLPRMSNLSWDDVCEMTRMGFEIGSHTLTHADLGAVSAADARREVGESKHVLEETLQRPVRWIAYPFGQRCNLRSDVVPVIQEAGYEACFSGHGGFISAGLADFVLPREAVPPFRSVLNLELHLTGCLQWMYALKRRIAAARREGINPCSAREPLFSPSPRGLHPSSAQSKI